MCMHMHTRTLQTFFCIFRRRDERVVFFARAPPHCIHGITSSARTQRGTKASTLLLYKNYIPLSASLPAPTGSFSCGVRFWMPRGRVRLSRRQTAERNAKKSPGGFLCIIYIIYGMYQTCGGRGVIEHQILLKYEHVHHA